MTHSRKRIDNPVCKDCGAGDNLKKDKYQTSGYRSICYTCDRKRQRIKNNGYDTGGKYKIPKCRDCGEESIDKLCPDRQCYMGVKKLCKSCAAIRMQKQRQKPQSNHIENSRKARIKLRTKVLNAYGNKCAYCGEKHYEFLAIDHVNDDGAAHRRTISNGDGNQILREIVRKGYPDTYQILCHNCNSAKGFYKCNPILIERTQYLLTEGYLGEGI